MNIFKILIVLFIFVFHLSVQSKSLVRNDISLSSVTSDDHHQIIYDNQRQG
jgi:hypothetical protein